MKTITIAEFQAACSAQGVPREHIAVKCPVCGTVQSIADMRDAIAKVKHASKSLAPVVVVGAPIQVGPAVHGCAVVVHRGAVFAGFPGGRLVTCGLTHVGPPERDAKTGEFRDLHGLYTRMRASEPSISGAWDGDDYVMRLTATIAEGWLHGYQLRLTRTYELSLTAPEIRLHDVVANLTDKPVPLMILYHFNMGYPMVRVGTRLAAAGATFPRDDEARKGLATWWDYSEAQSGYVEQVFFHHVQAQDGWTEVALVTGDALALGFRYNADALPYLTQWKNLRQGMYVHGVEPGNCIPEGRNAAEQHGRLDLLGAGETRDMGQVVLTVYSDAYEITQLQGRLDTLRNTGTPVAGFGLGE